MERRAGSGRSSACRSLREFLDTEVAGGLVLLAATVLALVWANSPWASVYEAVWDTELAVEVGRWTLALDLRHWVNDGLMALFFFVVGLEIKRELATGELRSAGSAALPALAALGGMVLAALLFIALNLGGQGRRGWGIPMATDIAFALGVLALFGSRVPSGLKLLLLSVLVVVSATMITVTGLVFALTIIALQIASGQYSPRLLRNFMRDRGTQVVLRCSSAPSPSTAGLHTVGIERAARGGVRAPPGRFGVAGARAGQRRRAHLLRPQPGPLDPDRHDHEPDRREARCIVNDLYPTSPGTWSRRSAGPPRRRRPWSCRPAAPAISRPSSRRS